MAVVAAPDRLRLIVVNWNWWVSDRLTHARAARSQPREAPWSSASISVPPPLFGLIALFGSGAPVSLAVGTAAASFSLSPPSPCSHSAARRRRRRLSFRKTATNAATTVS